MAFELQPGRPSEFNRFCFGDDGLLRPIWRAGLFVTVFLILYSAAAEIYSRLFGRPEFLPNPAFFVMLSGFVLAESWALLALVDERDFRSLGLWFFKGWLSECAGGLALGVFLTGCAVVVLIGSRSITYQGRIEVTPHTLSRLAFVALWLLLAAAQEELVFRGYLLQRLMESIGRPAAILVLSSLFGLAHFGNPSATALSTLNTILAGVLLSLVYLRARALWMPIGFHFAWNYFLGPVFSLPVSGFSIGPKLMNVSPTGPVWLTGGSYGPEGGVAVTLVCAAAITWLALTRTNHVSMAMQEALK
jgi:membrane protease YdiL (CAAX protease family)